LNRGTSGAISETVSIELFSILAELGESGTQVFGMLVCHNSTKYLLQNAVTGNPQKQYQAFQIHMEHICQIAKEICYP